MSKQEERFNRRRLRSSYVTTVISIALVLYMMGMLGLILINANNLSTYVKENIKVSVFMHEDVNKSDVLQLQKQIDALGYTRESEYISKQRAAEIVEQELGGDFISVLGRNPLTASIDIRLKADYANNDSIQKIEKYLLANPKVMEVFYQPNVIEQINRNIRHISMALLAVSGLLLLIAFVLINNTIRLAIYSKRLIIKSNS